MHCSNCGTKLPNDAAFCFKCGKQVGQGASASVDSGQLEYCQIKIEFANDHFHFLGFSTHSTRDLWWSAPAIGPNGQFIAGQTSKWQYNSRWDSDEKEDARKKAAHEQLVKYLLGQGWEVTPDSSVGRDLRFRRRVKR